MQYSAEGTKLRHKNQKKKKITSWRNKFNLTNRNVTIIMLARAAIQTNAARLSTIIASEEK